jgi:hypothetical protein
MMVTMVLDAEVLVTESATRIFPGLSKDEVLASLLFERALGNLIIEGEPGEEEEQDYFDWELAVAGVEDMKLDRLSELLNRP